MRSKVILLSVDALSTSEWEQIQCLPNFKRIMDNGTYSNQLISVYPTQTYTVHTTMVTGNYPDKHGIYNNHFLQPFVKAEKQAFFWYQHQIKSPTIYDLVKENKLKTCGLLWPVSGKSSIKYNLPEILALENESQVLKVLKNGSPLYIMNMERLFAKQRVGNEQPYLDEHIKRCLIYTIKNQKPDLSIVHLVSLDAAKHQHAVESSEVYKALENMDRIIGEILDAANDEFTIFLVGDHGHFTIDKVVHLNNLLQDANLLDGETKQWRAYIQSMGGSAALHVKEGDREAEKLALQILNDNRDLCGIEEIYNISQLEELHFGYDCKYVIEGKIGYSYKEDLGEVLVQDFKALGKKYATHGYNPNKDNYSCIFMTMGNGINKNQKIGQINMVDIAPTISHVMGLEFYPCDGEIIQSLFVE